MHAASQLTVPLLALALALALALGVACPSGDASPDGGSRGAVRDAGNDDADADAGTLDDAGELVVDAGLAVDAGSTPDAGPTPAPRPVAPPLPLGSARDFKLEHVLLSALVDTACRDGMGTAPLGAVGATAHARFTTLASRGLADELGFVTSMLCALETASCEGYRACLVTADDEVACSKGVACSGDRVIDCNVPALTVDCTLLGMSCEPVPNQTVTCTTDTACAVDGAFRCIDTEHQARCRDGFESLIPCDRPSFTCEAAVGQCTLSALCPSDVGQCDGATFVDCSAGPFPSQDCGYLGGTCATDGCVLPQECEVTDEPFCDGDALEICVAGQRARVPCSWLGRSECAASPLPHCE